MKPFSAVSYVEPTNKGRLVVEKFSLNERQVVVATAIRDAVEAARLILVELHPGEMGYEGLGLLAAYDSKVQLPSRYVDEPWDSILLGNPKVTTDAARRCHGTTREVMACAFHLHPTNLLAVSWAKLFEDTFAELWELKFSLMPTETQTNLAEVVEREKDAVVRAHYAKMASKRHAAAKPSQVEVEVIELLRENGARYGNKAAFIRDMLEKFGDRVKTEKTIAKWINRQPEEALPENWKKRAKTN